MQAHTECSPMLAMQMAINTRSAVNAVDMAAANFEAPHDVLEGPFGLYTLFEPEHELEKTIVKLGKEAQIKNVSHKPFPTGRACHGGLDALMQLIEKHGISADDIESGVLKAPPLIEHLTGRRPTSDMSGAYARLCFPYSAATYLFDKDVGVDCYDEAKLRSPERLALAERFTVSISDCQDPNAMVPQTLSLTLKDGRIIEQSCASTLGSPERPLSEEQHLSKFRKCCASAAKALSKEAVEKLILTIDQLEQVSDVSLISKLATQTESPV
jgi:2-methylcitrate dehydratase PrpD